MIRTALCAAIFAIGIVEAAWGQDYWSHLQPEDPDDLVIRASSDAGTIAEIVYDNSATLSSQSGNHVLSFTDPDTGESVDVRVSIRIGGFEVDGAEILTVTPPDTFMALPDYAEVPDGEVFIVRIVRAMF